MKIITDGLGLHEQALRARTERLELLSANIANADTPRFKARDLDFKAVMNQVQAQSLHATDRRHFATEENASAGSTGIKYRTPFNASQDGNTVEMSVEQAQYGKAAVEYRASLMFLENRVSTIKRALRGE